MNTIKKITFVILLCVSYNTVSTAQNLSSMSNSQRNTLLISLAKEVVLIHGPDYYREYGEPVITRGQVPPEGDFTGGNANRIYYSITFLYDTTKETLGLDFAASIVIWEDS